MSSRWVRIGLGVLVLGTWGAVIQRALKRPEQEEAPPAAPVAPSRPGERSDIAEALPPIPRDPFLEHDVHRTPARVTDAPPSGKPSQRAAAPATGTAERKWPEIRYNGIVRQSGDTTAGVAFLNVAGRNVLIRRGYDAEGVRVVRLAMDSVVVVWNSEHRTIHRK